MLGTVNCHAGNTTSAGVLPLYGPELFESEGRFTT
jgi:hypothetical protein